MRVLIVDDDAINRRVLCAMLAVGELHVVEASSGAHALARIEEAPVDIVLMDLRMPTLDGLETTRLIRGSGGMCATVPIAIVTADASLDLRGECLKAGADDLIRKPILITELYEIVGRLLVEQSGLAA